MQRQFDRLLEMLLLKQLNKKDAAKVTAYRLQVKARLYRFNYVCLLAITHSIIVLAWRSPRSTARADDVQEMLSQMTPEERKEALAKTYSSVVEDYERILVMTFH